MNAIPCADRQYPFEEDVQDDKFTLLDLLAESQKRRKKEAKNAKWLKSKMEENKP